VSERNAVQRAFDAFGAARFHKKRSGTWHRQAGVVDQSLNLQKSQYSLRYYLNVELAFVADGGIGRVVGRAEAFLSPADAAQLQELLDIDGVEMAAEHREHQLLALLDRLTPVLDEFGSVEALTAHDRRGTFKAMGVTGPARRTFDNGM
jgi:hypothetical protein